MRLNYRQLLPDAITAMLGLERVGREGMPYPHLLDLVRLRASQINGCAYCVRLHSDEARAEGVTDERLDMVAVWREADCFNPGERAALAWCEALTLLPSAGAPEELLGELRREFPDRQIVALTLAIVAINGWNRLNVAFRTPVSEAAKTTHPQAA